MTTFRSASRRSLDSLRDRFEDFGIDIAMRRGHLFTVERLYRARISRMRDRGRSRDRDRAITQDRLAYIYINQRRYGEALELLQDSLSVLERTDGSESLDTGVCCMYIARVYRYQEKYSDAERYEQKSIHCYKTGTEDPLPAALASDEHAVTLGCSAMQNHDAEKARRAVALADQSLDVIQEAQGSEGKEALRSKENNERLRQMLHPLLASEPSSAVSKSPGSRIALVTLLFVSHAYEDHDAVEQLLKCLPDYVKPVVFERISGSRENPISERLVHGVLGTDGMISIDSEISNRSIWTAVERDVAGRARKHMWRFRPETREISEDGFVPRKLWLAHLYHPRDLDDVRVVMRWLTDERGFEAFEDVEKLRGHSIPPLWSTGADERDTWLMSVRSFGAIYLIFMSRRVLEDTDVTRHVCEQMAGHSGTTMICWLDDPAGTAFEAVPDELRKARAEVTCVLGARPTDPRFDRRELDQLMAQVIWITYRGASGGMLRALGSHIGSLPR